MPSKPVKTPEPTFEIAIERLEKIVDEMEGDKLPLEQLLELYEEGAKLVKVCQEKLDTAEQRIEIISRNSSGKPQLAEFDPAAATPPVPAPSRASVPDPDDVSLF